MPITQQQINRINELAHKQKGEGLTHEEKEEQAQLRKEYIAAFRENITSQLSNIEILEPDGKVVPLKRKNSGKN